MYFPVPPPPEPDGELREPDREPPSGDELGVAAAKGLWAGLRRRDVEADLIRRGADPEVARALVAETAAQIPMAAEFIGWTWVRRGFILGLLGALLGFAYLLLGWRYLCFIPGAFLVVVAASSIIKGLTYVWFRPRKD